MRIDVKIGFLVGLFLAFSGAGCVFNPVADVAGGDGSRPDAALDSSMDGRVDASDGHVDASDALVDVVEPDGGCSPDGFERCNGDILEICRNGMWGTEDVCDLGCDPTKRICKQVSASNGVDGVRAPNPVDWTVTGSVEVDTDNGVGAPGGVVFGRVGGNACGGHNVDIGVFVVRDLVVQAGAELRFRGSNAVAVRALGKVEIHGTIRLSGGPGACSDDASVRCAGPGGFWGAGRSNVGDSESGDGPGGGGGGNVLGTHPTGGGGGGCFGHGGRGGNDTTTRLGADGGSGGGTYCTEDLQPLCGGSGGGSGGRHVDDSSFADDLFGGGGGGAIQITANEGIEISCPQVGECGIDAGGAGGQADHDSPYSSAGGGGGAGGAILLEGVRVQLDNAILSVAGGGGAGGYNSGAECVDGQQAPFSGSRAAGGTGALSGGMGAGGQGMAGVASGGDGDDGDSGATGGGGGGAGRIRVNVPNVGAFSNNGLLNPDQSVSGVLSVGTVASQ